MMRALLIIPLLLAAPAAAQAVNCAPRAKVAPLLGAQYNEAPHAMGLSREGLVMELWAAPSGTWTVTMTRADGLLCILASGVGYEAVKVVAGVPG
jgi:hypothetical protein